ncbi:5,6-dimethylbenzimidazole synthase [Oceanimonas pelagia]|uniref:5,6-dimethylbenzimidazole synthase n=1 Tax=Oceanimonas pelagia TaxID=3028314 RepID=A0AA50KMP2_9GAMM|nr:5,6-dimethylbenzimidazole synthase [Oceanimonas pelagia]WMC09918.1 5,6-dimethylbenzimidazole synthase [Oceanimonas pelagia]
MTSRLFSQDERRLLEEIIIHRRDIRGNRFTAQPVSDEAIETLLLAALHAPSVGFSQPWEFVVVRDPAVKQQVAASFQQENEREATRFEDARQAAYRRLKLEGITEAPVNLAVFYKPVQQPVLGQTAMPEMGPYSVVCAVQNMWLMARALNLGMGWVSIVDPERVKELLQAPPHNRLVAYLCIGHVTEFPATPELESLRWEKRKQLEQVVFSEGYGDR